MKTLDDIDSNLWLANSTITFAKPTEVSLNLFDAIQIKQDGTIIKLKNFTTEDEMSIRFWEMIDEAFPKFLKKEQNDKT